MNIGAIIDGIAGIVLIFFLYRGLVRGFSGEVIGLVGFFVGTFCAWKFTEPAVALVYQYLGKNSLDPSVVAIMCGVSIFFIVEIIFAVIGFILSYLVKVTQLSFTDHFFGMVIGVLKTAFIILIVYALLSTFPGFVPENWTEDSYAMKGASYVWPYVRDFLQSHGIIDFKELTGA
ncbi:MAG: CvpA family protein [Synergistaceae bacterium]|nr:CvpA family protein [Synergistaceae bacterium]